MKCVILIICCFTIYKTVFGLAMDSQGPSFIMEPLALYEFSNETGGTLGCIALGSPPSKIEWFMSDGSSVSIVANIREILPNGSLQFLPFSAGSYRQDVHSAVYRCEASNPVGRVYSKDAYVKAVVTQRYDVNVHDAYVFTGNTAILKCDIPAFVKEYVTVTSWVKDGTFNIFPPDKSTKFQDYSADLKYQMLPSGELVIFSVDIIDSHSNYRCRTLNRITGVTVESVKFGRVVITEHRGNVPPRYIERVPLHPVREGAFAALACICQGYPPPDHWWYRKTRKGLQPLVKSERILVYQSIVIINAAKTSDAATYVCSVNNSVGSDRVEHELQILQPLAIHVSSSLSKIDLGKNVNLTCTSSGLPRPTLHWTKDGIILREGISGGRRKVYSISSGIRLSIFSVQREDRGMYQCFAKNDYEMIQATTEIRLGDAYPIFAYKFIEQTMQPGPSVSLKCIATGNPSPHFVWTLDGFPLPNNDRLMIGQYVTLHGEVISHVNISSVRVEDGGEYRCVASNRVGYAAHSARLNIYGVPHIRPMARISAISGKDLIIKCPVAGYPISTVQWEKNERLLPINRRQEVTPNGTMIILKVDSATDRGTYTCTAKNKQNIADRQSVEIDIKVPPKIVPFSFPKVQKGSRVHMACVVTQGDSPVKIRWVKGGRPVQEHNPLVTTHQIGEFDLALQIRNAETGHDGNYTCIAENSASSTSYTASLVVNVPPRIAPFSFNKDLSEGVRAQVTCVIEKGDPPFVISWLKDFKPISLTLGLKIIGIDAHSSTIVLERITSIHTGNFTCLAKNSVAEVSHTAELVVSVPPHWVTEPHDQQAAEGIMFILHCQADGSPKPTLIWRKSVGRRPGNYRDIATIETGIRVYSNGTLVIHRLQEEHEGFYLCEAINTIGPGISKVIYLTVNAPPRFAEKHKNQTARLGLTANIRCDVKGDRPIKISWRKAGTSVDPASDYRVSVKDINVTEGLTSEISILATTRDDSGRFICLASNAFGNDEMSIQLYIQEPPDFPRNLHVIHKGSRTVKLGWIQSQDGNSPIKQYNVEYKTEEELWVEQQTTQTSVAGNQDMATVNSLLPATTYQFRLFAENELGRSQPSDILDVKTDGEPPSGPPTKILVEAKSSTAVQVNFYPPQHNLWNGEILGYHVGYREDKHAKSKTNFVTVEGPQSQGGEATIKNLKKFTSYSVSVQAFNAKGPGPASDDYPCATKEDVPSAPPQDVRCEAFNSQSLQVSWDPPPESQIHGVLEGYKVVWENAELYDGSTKPDSKKINALTIRIYGLDKYTNYSVQVLAFTRVGDGVLSSVLFCLTDEDVPEAPSNIKAVVRSSTSLVVSWVPPVRPNGIITTYNLYVREINSIGMEIKTYKRSLSFEFTYYEADDLHKRVKYEFSVSALTKKGESLKSSPIMLSPSSEVRAAIFSFGKLTTVPYHHDTKLPCRYVGKSEVKLKWKYWGEPVKQNSRLKILPDGGLLLKDLKRDDSGNYTCQVENMYGSEIINHHLVVQVPPSAPLLHATSSTHETINIQWKQGDDGSSNVRGFLLYFKCENEELEKKEEEEKKKELKDKENNKDIKKEPVEKDRKTLAVTQWQEIEVSYKLNGMVLNDLWCGSQYKIYIKAFNLIGIGEASDTITTSTEGGKPGTVSAERLIYVNATSVTLYLENWNDNGCPIQSFEIQYKRRDDEEWTLESKDVKVQKNYIIKNLLPATQYNMEITAHNHAGSAKADYKFQTITTTGSGTIAPTVQPVIEESEIPFYADWKLILPVVISAISISVAIFGLYYCTKKKPAPAPLSPAPVIEDIALEERQTIAQDNKNNTEQRDHYYATVRKPMRSPVRELAGNTLERIPEYSEDIYPYATFELNGDPSDSRCASAAPRQGYVYHDTRMTSADTLPVRESDSDLYSKSKRSRRKSRSFKSESEEYDTLGSDSDTEQGTSSRTESSNHLDGPGPSRERSGSQPFVRRNRILHTAILHGPESSTSTEPSPLFERKSFPRRGRAKMLQLASHSIETGRSGVSRDSSSSSFFFPAKLEPPTGFSDSIELSEAECDLDVARGLRMHQPDMRRPSFRASKRRGNLQDFTIAV